MPRTLVFPLLTAALTAILLAGPLQVPARLVRYAFQGYAEQGTPFGRAADPPQYTIYLPLVKRSGISAPVLKWQRGGCYSSWCETGWYSPRPWWT